MKERTRQETRKIGEDSQTAQTHDSQETTKGENEIHYEKLMSAARLCKR